MHGNKHTKKHVFVSHAKIEYACNEFYLAKQNYVWKKNISSNKVFAVISSSRNS